MSTGAPAPAGGPPQGGGAGQAPKPTPFKGESREQLRDFLMKYNTNVDFYLGTFLVLAIAYVKYIPTAVRIQADTLVGRLFLFVLTLSVAHYYNWLFGLFLAVFSILLMSVSPRIEGFQAAGVDVKLVPRERKWFVEEVFRENPIAIEEEKVSTKAIQDNTNSSNSTTSSR